MSDEERKMRDNFKQSFIMLGTKTIAEIKALAEDETQPASIALAAKALSYAFKNGNPSMFREIWDRTMGKVTQDINHSGNVEVRPFEKLTDDELDRQIAALEAGKTLPTKE